MTIDVATDERSILPEGTDACGIRKVQVSGVLSKIDQELYFEGEVSATLDGPCDRCLGEAQVPVSQPVAWYFERDAGDAWATELGGGDIDVEYTGSNVEDVSGQVVRSYDGHVVDLGSSAWEELMFSRPVKFLCREDCKGMCAHCGENLNDGPCRCSAGVRASGHPGLAKLKELYPDLPDRVED